MYQIIDETGKVYRQYQYALESEFERMIVDNADSIFGKDGIYFDLKKMIGTPKKGAAIPDGYFLDLTFHRCPKLYLVEVELNSHDVYGHIGEQLLRFGISSETDKYKLKRLLSEAIEADAGKQKKMQEFFARSSFDNYNALLDSVVFDNKPSAIIVINEVTPELMKVMAQLTMNTAVIEAQTYVSGKNKLHRFTPFNDDVLMDLPDDEDADELDTIVVPAREDGFQEEFIKNGRWFAIRVSVAMIEKIKYIAAYQVSPVSGITYIAEVDSIQRFKDTNKYIVYFKENSLQKISKVGLGARKGMAPQAPRYTSYRALTSAKTLDDLWKT